MKTGFAEISKGHLKATNTIPKAAQGNIIDFAWQLKKNGLSDVTIRNYSKSLETLVKRGANLFEPESIEATITSQTWTNSTKALVIASYKKFAVLYNIRWTPPKCEVIRKLPFIPLEKDIDELIASCGKKLSTVLQLLKETGMRIGEALRLDWNDVDFEKRTIVLNNPEKHGNPRMFKISEKLIAMLNRLPKDNDNVFGGSSWRIMFNNFNAQRKRSAKKLGNPRL